MFDIGWQELFIVALITIVVVGPKELPRVLRTATLWIRKIKEMARDFQDGLEDLAREADIDEMRKELESSANFDLEEELERSIDPGGDVGASIRELEEVVDAPSRAPSVSDDGPRPISDDSPEREAAPSKSGDAA